MGRIRTPRESKGAMADEKEHETDFGTGQELSMGKAVHSWNGVLEGQALPVSLGVREPATRSRGYCGRNRVSDQTGETDGSAASDSPQPCAPQYEVLMNDCGEGRGRHRALWWQSLLLGRGVANKTYQDRATWQTWAQCKLISG